MKSSLLSTERCQGQHHPLSLVRATTALAVGDVRGSDSAWISERCQGQHRQFCLDLADAAAADGAAAGAAAGVAAGAAASWRCQGQLHLSLVGAAVLGAAMLGASARGVLGFEDQLLLRKRSRGVVTFEPPVCSTAGVSAGSSDLLCPLSNGASASVSGFIGVERSFDDGMSSGSESDGSPSSESGMAMMRPAQARSAKVQSDRYSTVYRTCAGTARTHRAVAVAWQWQHRYRCRYICTGS